MSGALPITAPWRAAWEEFAGSGSSPTGLTLTFPSGKRRIWRFRRFSQREIEVLHVLLAAVGNGQPGFENQHFLAGQAEFLGDEITGDASAENDHVILRSGCAHFPPPLPVFTPKLDSGPGCWLQ